MKGKKLRKIGDFSYTVPSGKDVNDLTPSEAKDFLRKCLDSSGFRSITESINQREVIFTNKRNPQLVITVKKSPDGRIISLDNKSGVRFPFVVGQVLNRNVEVWACNNNFLMDNKDTCPDKKIFGIKSKDIPQGHELRHLYPNKF